MLVYKWHFSAPAPHINPVRIGRPHCQICLIFPDFFQKGRFLPGTSDWHVRISKELVRGPPSALHPLWVLDFILIWVSKEGHFPGFCPIHTEPYPNPFRIRREDTPSRVVFDFRRQMPSAKKFFYLILGARCAKKIGSFLPKNPDFSINFCPYQ